MKLDPYFENVELDFEKCLDPDRRQQEMIIKFLSYFFFECLICSFYEVRKCIKFF